ncbi:MAG: YbgC/FadM family acyl-CoA thioesterase [Bdellovibrionales bacterium]
MKNHTLNARVYYEDTDAGGIVYHAAYLRWAERGRTEWLRDLGLSQQKLRDETGLGFVVSRITIDYLAPARLDDELTIVTSLVDGGPGKASLKLKQEIRRGPTGKEATLATLDVTCACIDANGAVARLPEALYKQLQG